MTTFFKQRTFSDFFSDTIAFFKENGKDYFKKYFIINGGFLLLLIVLIYFVGKVFFESFFGSINSPNQDAMMNNIMQQNLGLFIVSIVVFIFLIIIISLLSYAFPIIYMNLAEQNHGKEVTTKQLTTALKNRSGKILIFFLGSLFVVTPLMLIVFGLCFLLCFILVGIPLLVILSAAFLSWYCISFFDYLNGKSNFFESFSNGFRMVKSQFWPIVGGTFLILMIIQILQSIVTLIPYFAGIVYFLASADEMSQQSSENMGIFAIFMAFVFMLAVLCSYVFNNFLVISQGMMYYSGREMEENNQSISQIENIGQDFE